MPDQSDEGTIPIEVELKFEVLDAASLQALFDWDPDSVLTMLAGFRPVSPTTSREVLDLYLDTAGGRLRTAGLAARIRSEGGRHRLTVKSTAEPVGGAIHRRLEVEGPARPTPDPATWPPSAARDIVTAAVGRAWLRVIACIRQRRQTRLLGRGQTTVELSLDELEALAGPRDERVLDRRVELEAELVKGELEDLEALAAALAVRSGLVPSGESKLDWARAALARSRHSR
ncbi:MAG TPA: CYTH domain-containing protein [Candidatus Deferrimicrobiaceae bacterium]|nr:CYTH domain-containing protein [Candidatus Deferrimicrobiaceae bacterium]